jgi:hypothetical protein
VCEARSATCICKWIWCLLIGAVVLLLSLWCWTMSRDGKVAITHAVRDVNCASHHFSLDQDNEVAL